MRWSSTTINTAMPRSPSTSARNLATIRLSSARRLPVRTRTASGLCHGCQFRRAECLIGSVAPWTDRQPSKLRAEVNSSRGHGLVDWSVCGLLGAGVLAPGLVAVGLLGLISGAADRALRVVVYDEDGAAVGYDEVADRVVTDPVRLSVDVEDDDMARDPVVRDPDVVAVVLTMTSCKNVLLPWQPGPPRFSAPPEETALTSPRTLLWQTVARWTVRARRS